MKFIANLICAEQKKIYWNEQDQIFILKYCHMPGPVVNICKESLPLLYIKYSVL